MQQQQQQQQVEAGVGAAVLDEAEAARRRAQWLEAPGSPRKGFDIRGHELGPAGESTPARKVRHVRRPGGSCSKPISAAWEAAAAAGPGTQQPSSPAPPSWYTVAEGPLQFAASGDTTAQKPAPRPGMAALDALFTVVEGEDVAAVEEQQTMQEQQPVAGPHGSASSASDLVSQMDGHFNSIAPGAASSMRNNAGQLMASAPPATASAPRGAANPDAAHRTASPPLGFQPAHAATSARFVLRRGAPPDKHLPCDYRLGRRQYETLELYDGWLRGDKLQVDESTFEDAVEYGEEIDDRCQAARVTRLLNTVLPKFFVDISDAQRFDARRPAATQHATFARHGWAVAPPTPGELMRRMVQKAEAAYRCTGGLSVRRVRPAD